MAHPIALIESIKEKLAADYPTDRFTFSREQFLPELKPKRMAPDLTVRDSSGKPVCLVEIGYTRPEKLKAYKDLGISDVRWYSKEGELINTYEATIKVLQLRYRPSPLERFYYYFVTQEFECPKCFDDWMMPDEECADEECDPSASVDPDRASIEASAGVETHCWISDADRGLAVSFCDQCGHFFEVHYSGDDEIIFNPLNRLQFQNLSRYLYHQRKQRLEDESWLVRPENSLMTLPPDRCSFEDIESYVKEGFAEFIEENFHFDYDQMKRMNWGLDEGWSVDLMGTGKSVDFHNV